MDMVGLWLLADADGLLRSGAVEAVQHGDAFRVHVVVVTLHGNSSGRAVGVSARAFGSPGAARMGLVDELRSREEIRQQITP
jgi:hypothetical protein